MPSRTQVTLDPELHKRAKRRAADLGISLAEYFRRLVADDLGGPARTTDPSAVFNLGNSGGSDVAKLKDQYVDDALRRRRRT